MSAVDVVKAGAALVLIPSQFSVADSTNGSVIAELFPNRFGHVTVMGYTLRVYTRSVPNTELGKGSKRELLWNPTEESVLAMVRNLEGPNVRRSALLIDGDETYHLLDQPYAVQVGTGLWEVTFYYQNED
jgi:hypothetical protein